MKHILFIAVAMFTLTGTFAWASIEDHYEENPISIQKAGAFDSDKQVKIRVGDKITFKIKIYQDEFFGNPIINANAKIDNTTTKKVKAIYSISFHDKDGKLVACHQGSWDLDPNDDVNYGSGIIYVDAESIASVTSYKLKTQVVEVKKE